MTEISKSVRYRNIDSEGTVTYRCMSCQQLQPENVYCSDDDMQHPICADCNACALITEMQEMLSVVSALDLEKELDKKVYDGVSTFFDFL